MLCREKKVMREAQFLVDNPAAAIDELFRKFGVWKTAQALLTAVWRRRQTRNDISHLSDRMRRDIGVAESDDLLEVRFPLWDVRL